MCQTEQLLAPSSLVQYDSFSLVHALQACSRADVSASLHSQQLIMAAISSAACILPNRRVA